ncbi:hypothetical protein [Pseudomonas sp. EL_65y_Pfl2_R96]|uniref:hypothetical protein n=1 Tax=Pseudomonas sp. EL_65y_Pfl2_R96 TaxID=3088699 RepID=UPI0030D8A767
MFIRDIAANAVNVGAAEGCDLLMLNPQTQKRHPKVPFLFITECRLSDQPANPDC